ncbi:DNA polymerase III subunit psi, partial [Marinobacter sp. 1Y8]
DIKVLNSDSQKLWQNITQALSITCETTSFPICDGMDTAELANASLAGYIFRIGRSEEIKVAALTVLPDDLQHPNLTTVPTLEEMLADSDAKRQLWEQISH